MARANSKRSAKKGTVRVNFKDVESRKTPSEGDYLCKVLEATSETSKSSGNEQITFVTEIAGGEFKGSKLYLHCPLTENSLWKLHAFLTALGMDVPEDEMDIDLSDVVDLEFVGVVTHELYNGRKRAKLTDFSSKEDYDGELEGDEDSGKKGKKKDKKSKDDDGKKSKKSKDDEDDKSSKKSKKDDKGKKSDKGKKKPKKVDRSDVEDMDEDELQELIDSHDLKVDLDDYKKLPKKVAAVIDALEEEDLLEDDD